MRQATLLPVDTVIMPRARSTRRWPRRTLSVLGSAPGVGVLLRLYVADGYQPPENRTDTPGYLAWMQTHHLDQYVIALLLRFLPSSKSDPSPARLP